MPSLAHPASPPAAIDRLLEVDTLTGSLRLYVPVQIAQKAVSLLRVLLLMYLFRNVQDQYNLLGLGTMLMGVLAPVLALGANNGMVRYAPLYETHRLLGRFYRRTLYPLVGLAVVCFAGGMMAARPIAAVVVMNWQVTGPQLTICQWALASALLMAIYYHLLGLVYGLRTYRLASLAEATYCVSFAVLAVAAVAVRAEAVWALVAHVASLVVTLAVVWPLVRLAVGRVEAGAAPVPGPAAELAVADAPAELPSPAGGDAAARLSRPLRQVLGFGLSALPGALLIMALTYLSYWLVNGTLRDDDQSAVFYAWLQLGQMALLMTNAAWVVASSHAVKRWEQQGPREGMGHLLFSYKMLSLATMTLAIVIYLTAPIWSLVLPEKYRSGSMLMGPMLMFFQSMAQLALLTTLARLRERPIIGSICAAACGLGNVLLALWLIPDYGLSGAALAAGLGTLLGGNLVAGLYFLLSRTRIDAGSMLLLWSPAVMLLSAPWAALAWLAVLAAAAATPIILSPGQKRRLLQRARGLLGRQR